jgi:DNA-binding CsgD family transcriptional regulator
MAERLTVTDRELDELLKLVDPQPGPGWPVAWSLLEGLNRLIPSDAISLFDLDSTNETTTFDQSLPVEETGDVDDEDDRVFWSHYWGSEPCSYPDRSGDLRSVTKISDFYSHTEWRNHAMYCDYFRPLGIKWEMMVCLPGGPGRTIRLVLFRGPGPDFTERDRGLLALLRPHLYEAYSDGERRSRGVPGLTDRQWQIMRLVAAGYSNAQIARRLFISEGTVRKHLENIFERLDVTNRIGAIDQAFPSRLA